MKQIEPEFFNQGFFRLPEDRELVKCLFTTMSMDLEMMLRMAALCLFPKSTRITYPSLPACLAEENRIRFFYDGNDPANLRCRPETNCSLRTGLEIPVHGDDISCFHPKIILLEHRMKETNGPKHPKPEPPSQFRLLVSSRNLTSAKVFETGVWLESVPCRAAGEPAGKPECPNHNLPELIHFLKDHTTGQDNFLDGLAGQLQNVNFVLRGDEAPGRVQVTVSGVPDPSVPESPKRQQDTLAKLLLEEKCPDAERKFKPNSDMIILSPDYETSHDAVENLCIVKPVELQNPPGSPKPIPTHGKLYYNTSTHTLWIGSANCSVVGLTQNVECVVMVKQAGEVWEETTTNPGAQTQKIRSGMLFGQPCVQYLPDNMPKRQTDPLREALKQFLKNHEICLQESTVNGKRQVTVAISPSSKPSSQKISTGQNISIELLPLGMAEEAAQGATAKWWCVIDDTSTGSSLSAGISKTFKGSKQEQATYALRLRATCTAELNTEISNTRVSYTAEDEIIYWQEVPAGVLHAEGEKALEDFICHPWLQEFVNASGAEELREQREQIYGLANFFAAHGTECDANGSNAKQQQLERIKKAAEQYYAHFSEKKETT